MSRARLLVGLLCAVALCLAFSLGGVAWSGQPGAFLTGGKRAEDEELRLKSLPPEEWARLHFALARIDGFVGELGLSHLNYEVVHDCFPGSRYYQRATIEMEELQRVLCPGRQPGMGLRESGGILLNYPCQWIKSVNPETTALVSELFRSIRIGIGCDAGLPGRIEIEPSYDVLRAYPIVGLALPAIPTASKEPMNWRGLSSQSPIWHGPTFQGSPVDF